jgi:hypothetical protein
MASEGEGGRPDYSAMTVNERLFVAGLLDEFERAARRGDRDSMMHMLRRVDVDSPELTVDPILADPKRYGF